MRSVHHAAAFACPAVFGDRGGVAAVTSGLSVLSLFLSRRGGRLRPAPLGPCPFAQTVCRRAPARSEYARPRGSTRWPAPALRCPALDLRSPPARGPASRGMRRTSDLFRRPFSAAERRPLRDRGRAENSRSRDKAIHPDSATQTRAPPPA